MKLSPLLVLPLAFVLAGLIVSAAAKIHGGGDTEAVVSAPSASEAPSSAPSSESTASASAAPVLPPPASASPTSTGAGTAPVELTAPYPSSTGPNVVVSAEPSASEPLASVQRPSAARSVVPPIRPNPGPVVHKSPEKSAEPKKPEPKVEAPKKPESKGRPMFGVEE